MRNLQPALKTIEEEMARLQSAHDTMFLNFEDLQTQSKLDRTYVILETRLNTLREAHWWILITKYEIQEGKLGILDLVS